MSILAVLQSNHLLNRLGLKGNTKFYFLGISLHRRIKNKTLLPKGHFAQKRKKSNVKI